MFNKPFLTDPIKQLAISKCVLKLPIVEQSIHYFCSLQEYSAEKNPWYDRFDIAKLSV